MANVESAGGAEPSLRSGGPWRSALELSACAAIVFSAASLGAMYPPGAWYESLRKPPLNPPNWIFAPVWTTLYLMMALAAWRVWRSPQRAGRWTPLFLFVIQLGLNAVWSPLFFGLHRPDLALIDMALLWGTLLATTIAFSGVDRFAGLLLAPYLCWVSFAAYLNFMLWRLNP